MKKKLLKKNTQKKLFCIFGRSCVCTNREWPFFMKLNKSRQDEFNVWDLKAGWYKNGTQKRRRPYRRKRDFPLKSLGFSQDTIPEISTTRASGSLLIAWKIWTLANFLESPKVNFISIICRNRCKFFKFKVHSTLFPGTPLSSLWPPCWLKFSLNIGARNSVVPVVSGRIRAKFVSFMVSRFYTRRI